MVSIGGFHGKTAGQCSIGTRTREQDGVTGYNHSAVLCQTGWADEASEPLKGLGDVTVRFGPCDHACLPSMVFFLLVVSSPYHNNTMGDVSGEMERKVRESLFLRSEAIWLHLNDGGYLYISVF